MSMFIVLWTEEIRHLPQERGYIVKLEEDEGKKRCWKNSNNLEDFTMDRDKRWQKVLKKAYNAIVNGEGVKATSAVQAIEASYQTETF